MYLYCNLSIAKLIETYIFDILLVGLQNILVGRSKVVCVGSQHIQHVNHSCRDSHSFH